MIYPEKDDIEDLIKDGLHLVDFYATWCGPCKMLEPILEEIKDEISVIKVNTDKMPKTTFKYRIMSIPTLLFFKDGKQVNEIIGFHTKEEIMKEIEKINEV